MSEHALVFMPLVVFLLGGAIAVAADVGPELVAATAEWALGRWRRRSRPGYGWPKPVRRVP